MGGSTCRRIFTRLYDRGLRAARGLAPTTTRAVSPSGRRLARQVPGLEIHVDETTRLPNLIISRAAGATLSGPRRGGGRAARAAAARTPEGAAIEFVRTHADLWELSERDAATVDVVSVSQPQRGTGDSRRSTRARATQAFDVSKLRTVNLLQRVDGVEVFNSEATGRRQRRQRSHRSCRAVLPGAPHPRRRSSRAARVRRRGAGEGTPTSAEDAIARAAFDLTNVAYTGSDFVAAARISPTPASTASTNTRGKPADQRPAFERPVRVKDVMFPLGDGQFVPAYYMELWIKGFPAFSYVMDAVDTPDLLYRKNLTSHAAFKYRVHNTGDALFRPHDGPAPGTPHPTGMPDGFQAPTVTEKLITIESLLSRRSLAAARRDDNRRQQLHRLRGPRRRPSGFGPGDVMGKVSAAGRVRLHLQSRQTGDRPEQPAEQPRRDVLPRELVARSVVRGRVRRSVGQRAEEQFRSRGPRRRSRARRRSGFQRDRQREHGDAGRRLEPAHADVHVHRHHIRPGPAITKRSSRSTRWATTSPIGSSATPTGSPTRKERRWAKGGETSSPSA